MDRRTFCYSALAGGMLAPALAQRTRPDVLLKVDCAPTPVRVEDAWLLVYELHVLNSGAQPIELTAVSIDGKRITGADLAARLAYLDGDVRRHAVLYIEVPATTLPVRLRHEVEYTVGPSSAIMRVHDTGVPVRPPPRIALGPPLKGGPWVAVHSPAWPRGHRRVFYTVDGRPI